MGLKTIEWRNNRVKMVDQTRLPVKLEYLYINSLKTLWHAIKEMKVRGAPALGAAAALGVYLGVKDIRSQDKKVFYNKLSKVIRYIASSRPTAKNLSWALERIRLCAEKNKSRSIPEIKKEILRQAREIIREDAVLCRRIGYYGAKLINKNDAILTICNAGILATVDYGTALGVIYRAKADGKKIKVFACETRPMLQGARITSWELKRSGVDVTLICDSMAASLMRKGIVNKVIAGADRVALNGDTANKIGTYSLAVLAKYHKIPFYIAAPASTFDLNIKSGKQIPIEQRPAWEVSRLFFKSPIAAKGVKIYNPAFDVTPADLIDAIITDKGLIRAPYRKNILKILKTK